jgi:hypothetical protein
VEHFILGVQPLHLSVGRPYDRDSVRDELAARELISGEINLDSSVQAIPPVEVDPLAIDMDLAAHQLAAEEVIDDQGHHTALAAGGVSLVPRCLRVRRIGVSVQRGTDGSLDVCERQDGHAAVLHAPLTPGDSSVQVTTAAEADDDSVLSGAVIPDTARSVRAVRREQESPMAQPRTPREVFLALVNGIAEGNLDGLPELYAEQIDVVHPFDPLRGAPLGSRAELRARMEQLAARGPLPRRRVGNVTIHETTDPEVIVAELPGLPRPSRLGPGRRPNRRSLRGPERARRRSWPGRPVSLTVQHAQILKACSRCGR